MDSIRFYLSNGPRKIERARLKVRGQPDRGNQSMRHLLKRLIA
jgi:hypothetical protein